MMLAVPSIIIDGASGTCSGSNESVVDVQVRSCGCRSRPSLGAKDPPPPWPEKKPSRAGRGLLPPPLPRVPRRQVTVGWGRSGGDRSRGWCAAEHTCQPSRTVVMRGAGIPGASMGTAPKCWGGRGGGTAAPGRHVGPRVPRGGRVGNHVVERMAAEAPRRRGTITWSKSSAEGGYTPYETLLERFDELDVVHRCTRVIQAPLSTCMEPWCDWKHVRKFVPQLVDVESIPQEDGRVRRLRMMYRFATTPTIELMTSAVYVGAEPKQQLKDALQQQNEGPGTGQRCKEVRWRSTEGFPQAGYVQFTEREAHKTEREGDPAGPPTETVVELEFTYRMPAVLVEFVGRHPVQVDVEKIVQDSMDRYVELCLKETHAEQA